MSKQSIKVEPSYEVTIKVEDSTGINGRGMNFSMNILNVQNNYSMSTVYIVSNSTNISVYSYSSV